MNRRIEKLRAIMRTQQLDFLLVTDKANRRYLSGFTGSNGLLVVGLQEVFLILDGRYTEQAQQQTQEVTIYITSHEKDQWQYLCEIVGPHTVGFEAVTASYATYQGLKTICTESQLVETKQWVEQLRLVKETSELQAIQKAAIIADQTFAHLLTRIQPGMSELEVANEIDYYSKQMGSEGPAFETIVASGVRTALPHAHASKKIIQANELIMIDFGCIVDGYYSDMTRTFALGEVDDSIRQVYEAVLAAQQTAIETIAVGQPLKVLDQSARQFLAQHELAEQFTHNLGHGIGLTCHEYPSLDLSNEQPIVPQMVFTVEPGVYLAGRFGIRIEDDIFVKADGTIESLTKTPKEWMVLPCN